MYWICKKCGATMTTNSPSTKPTGGICKKGRMGKWCLIHGYRGNKFVIAGKYDIYLSQVTLDEVGECHEPKRMVLFEALSRISYTKLEITNEVLKVANQIIGMGILTPKSFDDCQHIATAVVHGC